MLIGLGGFERLVPVVADSEDVRGSLRNFSPIRRPVVAVLLRLSNLPWLSGFGRSRLRLSTEAEAHKDDNGRKIVTSVKTFESMDGNGTKYSMTEKIAG